MNQSMRSVVVSNNCSESSGVSQQQQQQYGARSSPGLTSSGKSVLENEQIIKLFPKCRPKSHHESKSASYSSERTTTTASDQRPQEGFASSSAEKNPEMKPSTKGKPTKEWASPTNPFLNSDIVWNSKMSFHPAEAQQGPFGTGDFTAPHSHSMEALSGQSSSFSPTSEMYKNFQRHLQNPFLGPHKLDDFKEETPAQRATDANPEYYCEPAAATAAPLKSEMRHSTSDYGFTGDWLPYKNNYKQSRPNVRHGQRNPSPEQQTASDVQQLVIKEEAEVQEPAAGVLPKRRNKSVAVVSDGEVVIFEDSWYNLKAKPELCDGNVYKQNFIADPDSNSPEHSVLEEPPHNGSASASESSLVAGMVMGKQEIWSAEEANLPSDVLSEYSESPRRFGGRGQAPRPGFPLRIVAPFSSPYASDTRTATGYEKEAHSVNNSVPEGNEEEEIMANQVEGAKRTEEIQVKETDHETDDTHDAGCVSGGEDSQSGINVLEHAYTDTGLSVRDGDYSVPTSTFDYLYEFSETRKVLEEFFKCPTFELDDDEKNGDKLSESDCEADIRYDFRDSHNAKSPVRYDIHNLDSGSPTDITLKETIDQQHRLAEEMANEADAEDESVHEEENSHQRKRDFELSISSLGMDSCGDVDSLSGEFNASQPAGNYQLHMRPCYASMPVLEDGLSSGDSDAENNNSRNSRNQLPPSPKPEKPKKPSPSTTSLQSNGCLLDVETGGGGGGGVVPQNPVAFEPHYFQAVVGKEIKNTPDLNGEASSSIEGVAGNNLQYNVSDDRKVNVHSPAPGNIFNGTMDNLYFKETSPVSTGESLQMHLIKGKSAGGGSHLNYHSNTTSPHMRDENLNVLDGQRSSSNINTQIFKNTDPGLESLYSISKYQANGKSSF